MFVRDEGDGGDFLNYPFHPLHPCKSLLLSNQASSARSAKSAFKKNAQAKTSPAQHGATVDIEDLARDVTRPIG